MPISKSVLWPVVALVVLITGALAFGVFRHDSGTPQASKDKVIFLDQGWSKEVREGYYHISQGTTVMPYDIFLSLEAAGSQELFRSDANSERYGLTPDPADPQWNPDGLPIGLGKTVTTEGPWKGEDVGINCATCHNTELFYQGKRVRIDGGVGNHFDLEAYVFALDDAVQETLKDSAKFDRLAARMGASSADAKSDLRKRFETNANRIHSFRTTVLLTPYPWGPSRMDAIGMIVNRVTSVAPEIPQNWFAPLAPTKPPFLWNSPQGSWTQWRGVQQDPIDRNLTETMGVFMSMNLTAKSPEEGLFQSNARLKNLEEIEGWLNHLAPPKWPEEAFGKIDRAKAAQGKRAIRRATVRSATIPIPIRGPHPTSTASASLKLDWCRRAMWAPIRCSSKSCGRSWRRLTWLRTCRDPLRTRVSCRRANSITGLRKAFCVQHC